MFETLFGADVPLAVRFFIAFIIVLGLIGAAAWAVRRFGANRLGANAARGRQPRLAVIDAAAVDGRRRLVLIRRDNVEHLLMIGGPSDIVIEPSIVRATATREAPAARAQSATEASARPLPENGQWPLQPQAEPAPPARPQRAPEETIPWPLPSQSDQAARAHRTVDTLVGLADQLSVRPARDHGAASTPRPARPAETRPAEARPPAPQPAAAADAAFAATEKNLADMAHRLEAALRRPSASAEPRSPLKDMRAVRPAEPTAPAEPVIPTAPPDLAPIEPKPETADTKPAPGKSLYDSLEQEMANLLGRPPGKP
jgi:flagellar biogenesis protein FliO